MLPRIRVMALKLVRLASLYFSTYSGEDGFQINFDDVLVDTLGIYRLNNKVRILVAASMDLKYHPKMTTAKQIVVSEKYRKRLEAVIETIANLISVSEQAERHISSPTPYIALVPDDEASKSFLDDANGFLSPTSMPIDMVAKHRIELTNKLDQLVDRLDGVALLAESLTHTHPTGKFHEFIRLFERAFRLSGKQLTEPLSRFLVTSKNFGYTSDEVSRWIELRDPATHADQRNVFILESDVSPVVWRMEQAAYDILFNKAEWRSPTTERRELFEPLAGTNSATGGFFGTQGMAGVAIESRLYDEFRAYPLDLTAGLNRLPDGWWSKPFLQA